MLFNYLKLSFRLMTRNLFFTLINVFGLAVGFASFYALWEYSTRELKSDQYHPGADHIARIGINWNWTEDGGKTWGHMTMGFSPYKMLSAVAKDFPEVELTTAVLPTISFNREVVGHTDKVIITQSTSGQKRSFKEERIAYADSNFFTFYSVPFVYGRPATALKQANYVAVSQSTARKYFGEEDPTGEILELNDSTTLYVSGVYEDFPHNTHLNFDLVISNITHLTKWQNALLPGTICYVRLNHTSTTEFENKVNKNVDKYLSDLKRSIPHLYPTVFVQPLVEIPFSNLYIGDFFLPKSKPFLWLLAFIGASVLAMAWVNYVNLSVTRITRRLKEIATRKASGAKSKDMLVQFVVEAFAVNMIAVLAAFTLLQLIQQPFYSIFHIYINPISSFDINLIILLGSVIGLGILLTGIYPALIAINFQPRAIFRMSTASSSRRLIPSLLTVSQMTAAIIFIVLGFMISIQLNYILTKDTGIKRDDVIVIEGPVVKPSNYASLIKSLKNELARAPYVQEVTNHKFEINLIKPGLNLKRTSSGLLFGMDGNCVDEDLIPFYGFKIVAGRNFRKQDLPNAIIISRHAAKRLGFTSPEEAIGSNVNVSIFDAAWQDATIIGIIEDFRDFSYLNMTESFSELNQGGRGIVLLNDDQKFADYYRNPEFISLRIKGKNFNDALSHIEQLFRHHFPDMVFSWAFLEDKMNDVYAHEKVARNQVILFTVLAIGIACLGLLGMISNRAMEKLKEIGIRKVLGATIYQIGQTLLNAATKHMAFAVAIGIPAAYYFTQMYLEKYSEHIALQWWHFVLPVAILVGIMFLTIISVLWKAANGNPVDALKCE